MCLTQKQKQVNFKARGARAATREKKLKLLEALVKLKDDPTISLEKKREFGLRVIEFLRKQEKGS